MFKINQEIIVPSSCIPPPISAQVEFKLAYLIQLPIGLTYSESLSPLLPLVLAILPLPGSHSPLRPILRGMACFAVELSTHLVEAGETGQEDDLVVEFHPLTRRLGELDFSFLAAAGGAVGGGVAADVSDVEEDTHI